MSSITSRVVKQRCLENVHEKSTLHYKPKVNDEDIYPIIGKPNQEMVKSSSHLKIETGHKLNDKVMTSKE